MWYQVVSGCGIWYQVQTLANADPIQCKAFQAAFCYGFTWYQAVDLSVMYRAIRYQMPGNADPIACRAFIGVFQGYNVAAWYPVFCQKVSRGVDMLLVIVTDNMVNLFSTVAGFKVRFRAKSQSRQ